MTKKLWEFYQFVGIRHEFQWSDEGEDTPGIDLTPVDSYCFEFTFAIHISLKILLSWNIPTG